MLIYGHNLHEKLLGIAISKDYIKYATPFCDLVDDPELALDIDIAVNYNKAINGDSNAARLLTNSFILSGGFLDPSTRNFYRDKMANNPHIFASEIDRMNGIFDGGIEFSGILDDGGLSRSGKGSNIFKDCWNSPCNLFAQTSDSIGRMAQAASTKNGANSFSVGALKGTFVNVINGLDQAIFNKIPSIFQNAIVDITQTASKARENTQEILAGKKNLDELVSLAQSAGTMRDGNKVYRYTPDIKSYLDYSDMGASILSKVKDSLGGCFSSFEHAYRYNPYEHNTSTPMGIQVEQYNGKTYDRAPNGVTSGSPVRVGQLTNTYRPPAEPSTGGNAPTRPNTDTLTNTFRSNRPAVDDGKVIISESITLGPKNKSDGYSTFGAGIFTDKKWFLLDDYGVTADDQATLDGISAFGNTIKICPSRFLKNPTVARLEAALAGEMLEDVDCIVNKYSQGWRTLATQLDVLHEGDKVFNDGVAPSAKLWRLLLGDVQASSNFKFKGSFYTETRKNRTFVAVRKSGGPWVLIKVVDINSQNILNVDFTPGAYAGVFGNGDPGVLTTRSIKAYNTTAEGTFGKALADAGWKVMFHGHNNNGQIEVKACIGNKDEIMAQLGIEKKPPTKTNTLDGYKEGSTETVSKKDFIDANKDGKIIPEEQHLAALRSGKTLLQTSLDRGMQGEMKVEGNVAIFKADQYAVKTTINSDGTQTITTYLKS